jgi:NADH-quinone oxidoreductase subunit A
MLYAFLIYVIATFIFALILFVVSALMTYKTLPTLEKFDLYECGFKAFDQARQPININFFLIGILFVIFDIETVYLLPWLMNFINLGYSALYLVFIFVSILIAGYVYDFKEGLLDWAITHF